MHGREAGAVGQLERGVQLEQRLEHEAARGDLGVRQGQRLAVELDIAQQEHVDVDGPRAVAPAAGFAPQLDLDRLACGQELRRFERRP